MEYHPVASLVKEGRYKILNRLLAVLDDVII